MLWKSYKKAIKALTFGFLISAVFFLFIPFIPSFFGLPNVLESKFWMLYLYTVSTLAGIYFIKDQEQYIKIHNDH